MEARCIKGTSITCVSICYVGLYCDSCGHITSKELYFDALNTLISMTHIITIVNTFKILTFLLHLVCNSPTFLSFSFHFHILLSLNYGLGPSFCHPLTKLVPHPSFLYSYDFSFRFFNLKVVIYQI